MQGLAPSLVTKGAAVYCLCFGNSVNIPVSKRVAVGVNLKLSDVRIIHRERIFEKFSCRNIHCFSMLKIECIIVPGHHNSFRAPRKLVLKRIIHRFGSRQCSANAVKLKHSPFFGMDMVNNAHGRHMIYTGIEPDLVQDNNPCFPGFPVQFPHFGLNIRSSDHILFMGDAMTGHHHMKSIRKKAYSKIMACYQ